MIEYLFFICYNFNVGSKMKKIKMGLIFFIMILDLLLLIRVTYFRFYEVSRPIDIKSYIKDDKIHITFYTNEYQLNNKAYCIIKKDNEVPSINDKNWKLSNNSSCVYKIEKGTYKAYVKTADNKIIFVEGSDILGSVTDINTNKEKIYLAINEQYSPTINIDYIGNAKTDITWTSENNNIATVSHDGKIKGISEGETKITATSMDKSIPIKVIVTDLINTRPNHFNNKKPYLPCGIYSKEDNDLLDTILEDRINTVGYQTRAGAVEAA